MKVKNKFHRMFKILSMAFMIVIQVYWYKLTKKSDSAWEALWGDIGKRYRETLFELEGLLIKVGQMLSIRADLLPKPFIEQIQDLTDKVPPSKWEEIETILKNELGESYHHSFSSINQEAIASASIGEVYKGTLNDGKEVAIKVQRPYIESIVQTDFRALGIIIWFADHFVPIPKDFINFKLLYKELKQVIERELDFENERAALLSFQDRFKESNSVKIPHIYTDLSTSRVLVMEWVEGTKFTDIEKLKDLGLNSSELAKSIIEVFLPQWLEPGLFHADPHPGNILVSNEGKIILLDFGMVGEITKQDATYIQSLVEGFLLKDYKKMVDCLTQLGFLLPEADTRTMEKIIREFMNMQPTKLEEKDLIALKLEQDSMIRALPIQVPTRFVFLGRSFVTIQGILNSLIDDSELKAIIKPVFIEWVKTQGNSKWRFIWTWIQSQPIFKVFHAATEFLQLPEKLEDLKEVEQRRQFQFTIYENNKKRLFQTFLLSLIGVGVGYSISESIIYQISIGVAAVSIIGYFISSYNLKKWMKYMQEGRK